MQFRQGYRRYWQLSGLEGYCYFKRGTTLRSLMSTAHPTPAAPTPPAQPTAPARHTLIHPAAGALILGLDWVLFSSTVASGGAALTFSMITGFVIGGLGTGIIQRRFGGDSRRMAMLKGLAAGVVVGVPFPVAGTAVGGTILALSGLDRLLKRRAPNNR